MKLKVILTGATGMVGEGVLHECLLHPDVERVLIINRKPSGITHPKLKEIIHADFYNLAPIEKDLGGHNTCLFCLGTSSIGMSEADFTKIAYTLTMHVANTLVKLNPDTTFCYISGAATDSTEKGRTMWARVKGKTENDLMKLPFKAVYNFRPGYIHPTPGLKNTLSFYKYISWLYPIFKLVSNKYASTMKELGLAMINAARIGYEKPTLEVPDIIKLSKEN